MKLTSKNITVGTLLWFEGSVCFGLLAYQSWSMPGMVTEVLGHGKDCAFRIFSFEKLETTGPWKLSNFGSGNTCRVASAEEVRAYLDSRCAQANQKCGRLEGEALALEGELARVRQSAETQRNLAKFFLLDHDAIASIKRAEEQAKNS